jgi:hypothetical protein
MRSTLVEELALQGPTGMNMEGRRRRGTNELQEGQAFGSQALHEK